MQKATGARPVNWRSLPDAITEAEFELELTWSAGIRTRRAIVRQGRLMGFQSPTEYLVQALAATIAGNESDTIIADDGRILNGCAGYDRARLPQNV